MSKDYNFWEFFGMKRFDSTWLPKAGNNCIFASYVIKIFPDKLNMEFSWVIIL